MRSSRLILLVSLAACFLLVQGQLKDSHRKPQHRRSPSHGGHGTRSWQASRRKLDVSLGEVCVVDEHCAAGLQCVCGGSDASARRLFGAPASHQTDRQTSACVCAHAPSPPSPPPPSPYSPPPSAPAPVSVSYNLQNGLPTGWTHQSGAIGTAHSLAYGISLGDAGTIGCDTSHPTARVTSPRFASCTEVRVKMEGGVSGGALVSNVASLPCSTSTSGFLGAAVRSTTTGDYLMNGNCMTSSGWESSGYASCWSTFDTSSLTGDGFVVDLIDYKGGGGWGCNSFVTVELNGCVGLVV